VTLIRICFDHDDAVVGALSNEPPVALKLIAKRRVRRQRAAPRKTPAAAAS
jgi:hypothetical protein